MEKIKNTAKFIGIIVLVLCNIMLIVAAVLFTVEYSKSINEQKEATMMKNFCDTVDTMRQISERYLDTELSNVKSMAAYIKHEHMTMDEALSYIITVDESSTCEAHFVDMDTFEAWSTNYSNGDNSIGIYRSGFQSSDEHERSNVEKMRRIFDGEKCVLGRYNIKESQRVVTAVGTRVTLREEDGSDRDYLLLRVIPIERMKGLWLFPSGFSAAQIGLISTNGDYIIPSNSMRSDTFMEFVRSYNFSDDYFGANRLLAQLKEQNSGLLELNDAKNQPCYWYYSRLDNFDSVDILGYIPASELVADTESLSIVVVVAGIMLLLIFIDGGYIMNINRRLRETAKLANRANMSKTQFLSTMSHDIRTPLNAVLGMTELAQNRIDDKEYVKECLGKITVSGNHLLTLINDILEISRVESGNINLTPAPFDVKMLISNLENLTRSQAAGHGLKFDVETGELPRATLKGDKLRLTQIYLNLLNNAVKYTKAGGTVRLKMYEENVTDDGNVTLVCVVKDTGMGMTPEFQKIMYDSFERVSDARIDKIQGTGLGLAIVKRMVNLMDGSIECESTVNVGTTFTVRIPLCAAPDSDIAPSIKTGDTANDNDLIGLRILVAEDNDINWEIVCALLEGYGIDCYRAENGRQCVDILSSSTPGSYDMVFMDVQMPVLGGLDATREIRASDREDLRRIPIAAMTADAFAEDVQGCIEAGMNAHISKPIEIDKVISTIRLLISRAKSDNR